MHVGLIGGIGPAATDYYYRGLIDRHAIAGTALDLTIAHADAREFTANLSRGDSRKQAAIFADLVRRLAAAGADAIAITSMSGHFCVSELEPISSLPILNAIPAVVAAIQQRRLKRIGILGTRTVMLNKLYGAITEAEIVPPDADVLEQVHKCYIDMAITGRVTDDQRQLFVAVGQQLCRDQGTEAVILGGTDLVLAFDGRDCGFPLVNCAEVHVDSIWERSTDRSEG
jgi:aspartate racemase